jgi:glycosyltransferase involved in cell wall biosynthesis
MKNFFFSFIIPTFNREHHLKKTINSLLNQKYKLFEIIIIDDGSTDNTHQLIKNLKNSKIKYFYQENSERGKARNFGISKAKGDYINFFDSDDTAYDFHLQLANNILQKTKLDIIHLGHHIILNNKIIKTNNPEGILNKKILFGNIMLPISTFINRKISKEFFFSEDKQISGSEDYIYWLNISKKYKIYGFPQVTSALTMHKGRSMLTTTASKTEKRILKTINYIEHKIKLKKYKIQLIKGNCFMLVALEFSIEKNYQKTFEYIKYIFFECPIYFISIRFIVILKNLIF